MPRVHYVKSARKAQPNNGIQIGDSYYWWKFRFGGKRVSKSRPDRSQLTQSEFLGRMWSIEDDVITKIDTAEEARDAINDLEELRDETEEKLNNMPDQLQYAPTGELLQERIDYCEEMINELDNQAMELEDKQSELDELENNEPAKPGDEPDGENEDEWDKWNELTDTYEEWDRDVDYIRETEIVSIQEEIRNISYDGG